ncbi:MAG TPA: alpha/beta hydrolase [Steroidobacteraceae bacterium]|jgi:acetyl esterase/lipase|nr:alpha/beta hydrolase [Steroidobacteraceae bacterium]
MQLGNRLTLLALLGAVASAGHVQAQATAEAASPAPARVPIWPATPPDAQPAPGPPLEWTNIVQPTLAVYSPKGRNTGVAVVVLPGGGFEGLALKGEGTDACDWLTSNGITCVLLRYRVPSLPYDWHCKCRPDNHVTPRPALEDVQRTMGLIRLQAARWHVDPHKIGVLGFSAGGYLVAEISTRYEHRLYSPLDGADEVSCRPDFAVAVYPGHLWMGGRTYKLNPNVPVTHNTPPTFLVQAENDNVDGVSQSIAYYIALKDAGVPVEMHLYAQGGHAFGLQRTRLPITNWPQLVHAWLGTIGMIGK